MSQSIFIQLAQKIDAGANNIPALSGDQVLGNVLNVFYFLVGITAVIVIIVGGIMYITSRGDSGLVSKAKNLVLYAVVGLVVVMSAFAITNFVIGAF